MKWAAKLKALLIRRKRLNPLLEVAREKKSSSLQFIFSGPEKEALDKVKEKMIARGIRGIIGLKRKFAVVFLIIIKLDCRC